MARMLALALAACASPPRGTGDLGLVVERAAGRVMLIETSGRTALGRVEGLGDLSHAAAVFSRDGRYAYVFGRGGGLTKVDLLRARGIPYILATGYGALAAGLDARVPVIDKPYTDEMLHAALARALSGAGRA